jgi:glycosyltransferase involved in cell wall biosynthesis
MKNVLLKPTVTIGIPAYNEASNIGQLLTELLKQREEGFIFDKIMVCSDGSSDETCSIVRDFVDTRIMLIDNSDRKGKASRQNQMIELCSSDIFVLLDADILFYHSLFIHDLVMPLVCGEADFVSGKIMPISGTNYVDRALQVSMDIKSYMYEHFNQGLNVYTCYGPARGFTKKAYSVLHFETVVAEDAYSYLFCIKKGLKYSFVPAAQYFVKLPENVKDHQKQSVRFMKSIVELETIFGKEFVTQEYAIPLNLYIAGIVKALFSSPFYSFIYVLLNIQTKFVALTAPKPKVTWDMANSSKGLK